MCKIIAFYLPQYHEIPENNEWWGKGFTEWDNVKKAKPLFDGHLQPRIPSSLGYYDLTNSEVIKKQVSLAKEHGVFGFCYWHYWFGEGKRLLEKPFNDLLKTRNPDFPFCLGWANESWESKVWGDQSKNKILIEQKYLGYEDNLKHFETLLPAFMDDRYIKCNDKCVFYIYKPFKFYGLSEFINQWRNLAQKNGFDFYFIANTNHFTNYKSLRKLGFDAITVNPISRIFEKSKIEGLLYRKFSKIFYKHSFFLKNYKNASKRVINYQQDIFEDVIPSIVPNWDHSPRSGSNATILFDSSPELFQKQIEKCLSIVSQKHNQIIFLKSWNEWGEGNFIEPDSVFGTDYLQALKNAISISNNGK